jgi:hypothetical protein
MDAKDTKVVVDLASQLEVAIKLLAHARRLSQQFEDGEVPDWWQSYAVLDGLESAEDDPDPVEMKKARALIEAEAKKG